MMIISKSVIEDAVLTVDLTVAKLHRLAEQCESEDERHGIEEAMAVIETVARAFKKKHDLKITVKR